MGLADNKDFCGSHGESAWRAFSLVPAVALLVTTAWSLTSDQACRASRATNVTVHLDEELLRH
jgi:hypothetical protein